MREEWKDVKSYEGYYMVSNLGNVKSLNYKHTGKEKILKPSKNRCGYLKVGLCKDGKRKNYYVHRLVAAVFCANPLNYNVVNHKDENKLNNNANNLEWCTQKYNSNYGTGTEKIAEKLRGRKRLKESVEKGAEKVSKPVYSVNKESGLIMWWQSIIEASRQLGISNCNICACLKGRLKSCGGHYWFYADDNE